MKRNEEAAALRRRAGHAATAIAVDTRPRVVRAKRGKGAYDRGALKRRDRTGRDPDQAAAGRPFSWSVDPWTRTGSALA